MRFLRLIRVTNNTSRGTTWLDVFTEQKKYVTINFVDGKRLFGWPQYYSNNPEEGMLYISEPSWLDEENNEIKIKVTNGILIVNKLNIDNIEFHNDKTNQLFAYLEIEDEEKFKKLSQNKVCHKWWRYMKEFLISDSDNSIKAKEEEICEVFHID
jgi:L-rhamnose mutarotase